MRIIKTKKHYFLKRVIVLCLTLCFISYNASATTTGEENALMAAKQYLSLYSYSAISLSSQLGNEGFSSTEVEYAMDNCGVDWNEQALLTAKSYLEYSYYSKRDLVEQLELEGFTASEASYGVKYCGEDWNEQALKTAKSYLEYFPFSKKELISQLLFEGFTSSETIYGVDNCGADWYDQAERMGISYLSGSSFTRQQVLDHLLYMEFTYSEAEYGTAKAFGEEVSKPQIKNSLNFDEDGIWRYYENDTFVEKTGIVDFEGGQFYIFNGVLCSDVNGLTEIDGQWYFLVNGQIQKPVNLTGVIDFVERCYSLILGRYSDEAGLNNWINALVSGTANASQIISGFMSSEEYANRQKDNSETVEILYNTMLGRSSDPAGKQEWTGVLDGSNVNSVINGFCGSQEFLALCDDYGIEAGSIAIGGGQPATGIDGFVARCYNEALGRTGDEDGITYWKNILTSKEQTPQQVAAGFMFSKEMDASNKLVNNPDTLLDSLYKLYLGRPADEAGKEYWKQRIAEGLSLEDLNAGFANSAEFTDIVAGYGLE